MTLGMASPRLITVAMAISDNSSRQFRHRLGKSLQRHQVIDLHNGRNCQHIATLKRTLWLTDRAYALPMAE